MFHLRTATAVALVLLSAPSALAHVVLEKSETAPGVPYKAILKVGHGCAGAATTSLSVEIPEGLADAKPMPKPGWQVTTEQGAYATPVTVYGHKLEKGTRRITWTGGRVGDDQYDEFVFAGFVAPLTQPTTLYLPVVQGCETSENRWVETPAAGQTLRDLKMPAAVLRISAPGATAASAAPTALMAGPIRVEQAWSRATPGGAKVGAGYLRLTNTGTTPDRLVSGTTDVAERFEVHEMSNTDGVMKMRQLGDGLALPSGQTVELRPGGFHIMLMGLKQPLASGARFTATLTFEKAGKVTVPFLVQPIGAGAPGASATSEPEMDHSMHMGGAK